MPAFRIAACRLIGLGRCYTDSQQSSIIVRGLSILSAICLVTQKLRRVLRPLDAAIR